MPVAFVKIDAERAAADFAVVVDIGRKFVEVGTRGRKDLVAGWAGDVGDVHWSCFVRLRNRR